MNDMHKELELVRAFHKKFHALISHEPTLIPKDRTDLRYRLMHDEVEEYKKGVEEKDLENIAKELADVLFATYGTILEHGLQEKMPDIFEEVCRSNMSKDYHQYKMVKGENYFEPDVSQFFD